MGQLAGPLSIGVTVEISSNGRLSRTLVIIQANKNDPFSEHPIFFASISLYVL